MKKSILALAILFMFQLYTNCQTTFSLREMIAFANTNSIDQFDEKVRKHGYSINNTENASGNGKRFIYTKEVSIDGDRYNCKFDYIAYPNDTPLVIFITADKSQINKIRKELKDSGFKLTGTETPKDEIKFIYKNSTHILELQDIIIRDSDGDYNIQRVNIYRKP